MEGNKQHIGHLGHTAKHSNTHTHIMGLPKGEERKKGDGALGRSNTQKLPNFGLTVNNFHSQT